MAAFAPFLPIEDLGYPGWQMLRVGFTARGELHTAVRFGDGGIEISFLAGDAGRLFDLATAHMRAVEARYAATLPPKPGPAWPSLPVPQLPPAGLPLFDGGP